MDKTTQSSLAERFRQMHRAPPLLLLPNAWDAASARIFEAAGFGAVASTSGGVAWALGYPDGQHAPWHEVVAATARIARAVRVPVTADIEAGYGESPEEVAANVAEIIESGAVGINLEDGTQRADQPVRALDDTAARVNAARGAAKAAGVPIVINARIDVYAKRIGDAAACFEETVRRAKAYVSAGADCLYPFGVTDPDVISELVQAIEAPINIVGRPGTPEVAVLERIGVARVSTASGPSLAALALTRKIADELHATGRFDGLASDITRADMQALFAPRDG